MLLLNEDRTVAVRFESVDAFTIAASADGAEAALISLSAGGLQTILATGSSERCRQGLEVVMAAWMQESPPAILELGKLLPPRVEVARIHVEGR